MATSSAGRRTVRESTALVRSRSRAKPVMVTVVDDMLELRLKGERKKFRLSLAVAYGIAVQAFVEAQKARRRADRAAKRKGK